MLPFFGRRALSFAFLTLAFAHHKATAQETKPTIEIELSPTTLTGSAPGTLTVTLSCPVAIQDSSLQVFAPSSFTATAKSPPQMGTCTGTRRAIFELSAPHTYIPSGEFKLTVFLSDKTGQLTSGVYTFGYTGGLSLWLYFLLGVLGIAIGYTARLVVDSLNNLPKPVVPPERLAAPEAGAPNLGWFTVFMKKHYYFMDFVVTLMLGFLALAALVKDNHVPDSGLFWYSAFGLGFGIGLLTNSDLITRLRTK